MKPIRVLFLAADPKDTTRIRLSEEARTIDERLQAAEFRDRFELIQSWAVRETDLAEVLLRYKPHIVHFSGHGSTSGQIILESRLGMTQPVSAKALSDLFGILSDNVRCVVLNACFSQSQAESIVQHIDCVVGMSHAISVPSAVAFAGGFYRGLGWGRSIQTSFQLGCNEIDLGSLGEPNIPKLLVRTGVDPASICLLEPNKSEFELSAKALEDGQEEYHFFVAHEFSRKKKDDLRDAIARAFMGTGLNAYYADLEIRQSHILGKLKDMVFKTQFGIYDISNPNKPNVFLELGFAIAAEQPFYIICEEGTEVPAALAGLHITKYESYRQLTQLLVELVVKGEIGRLKYKQKREVLTEDEILRNPIIVYQAEGKEIHHAFGIEVSDKDAGNQKAWYGDSSMPCPIHLMYGPYHDLPEPGAYKAVFKLKTDRITDIKEILHIDVISNSNPSLNSYKAIRGIQFDKPNTYQLFGVEFRYQHEADVEYRVIKLLQERHIWIDYVAVVKQSD